MISILAIPLPGRLIKDTTVGLLKVGIKRFPLNKTAASQRFDPVMDTWVPPVQFMFNGAILLNIGAL